MCGCHLLQELDLCPPPSSGNAREDAANLAIEVEFAREQQARWGCPAAGFTPPATLPRDLAGEARHAAKVTHTPVADTCPFACVERANPWLAELTRAVSLSEWMSFEESLQRDITHADLIALTVLKRAQSDATRSNREIADQEREAAAKARASNG